MTASSGLVTGVAGTEVIPAPIWLVRRRTEPIRRVAVDPAGRPVDLADPSGVLASTCELVVRPVAPVTVPDAPVSAPEAPAVAVATDAAVGGPVETGVDGVDGVDAAMPQMLQ